MTTPSAVVTFLTGIAVHAFYLHHGEHHMQTPLYIKLFLSSIPVLAAILSLSGLSIPTSLLLTSIHISSFLTGLLLSLLTYRLLLNPLNRFPGPPLARFSSLYLASTVLTTHQPVFRTLLDLHNKHGEYVRIGTNEISITHAKAVMELLGPESKCTKSEWYDQSKPYSSTHSMRDKGVHAKLRRIWAPAMGERAVRGYEVRIQRIREMLLGVLDEVADGAREVDVTNWISMFSYDVMSDVSFGRSFGMLEGGTRHWVVKMVAEGMRVFVLHLPMWVFRMAVAVPGALSGFKRSLGFYKEVIQERWENQPEISDVMGFLMAPYKGQAELDEKAFNFLTGEANLLVVAGSDTTALTLTCAMMLLAQYPEQAERLREELESVVDDADGELWHTQVNSLKHLNGVIWETLRLYPAVPSYPVRLTPPESVKIGHEYIPGGTKVICPAWVMGRKEEIYTQAEAFIPERWYKYPEMVKDKSVWAPFSAGSWSCIGKPFALMNLRVTLARIVLRYDIKFAPSTSGNNRESFEAGLTDQFTLAPPPLKLCLHRKDPE